jgi:hypothetical protein
MIFSEVSPGLDAGVRLQTDSTAFLEYITAVRGGSIPVHQRTNGIYLCSRYTQLLLITPPQEAGTAVPSFTTQQLEALDPKIPQQTAIDIVKWAGASMLAGGILQLYSKPQNH